MAWLYECPCASRSVEMEGDQSARITLYYLAFSVSLAHGIIISLLSLYLDAMGFKGLGIGLFNAGFTVASALASWTAGRLSASRGYACALLAALIPPTLVTPLYSVALVPSVAAACVMVYGLSSGAFSTAAVGLLSEIPGPKGAAVSFGAFYTAMVLGRTLSGTVAGVLIERLGYGYLLLSAGLIMATAMPPALSLRRSAGRRGAQESGDVVSQGDGISKPMKLLLLALFLHTMGFMAVSPFFSLYALKVLGIGEALVGTLMSIRSSGVLFSQLAAGYLTQVSGSAEVLTAHVTLSSVAWASFTLARGYWSAAAILLAGGVVGALDMPARRTLISELSKPGRERARAMGLVDLTTGIASAVGFLLGGILWDHLGPEAPFLTAAAYNALAVPLIILIPRLSRSGRGSPTLRL